MQRDPILDILSRHSPMNVPISSLSIDMQIDCMLRERERKGEREKPAEIVLNGNGRMRFEEMLRRTATHRFSPTNFDKPLTYMGLPIVFENQLEDVTIRNVWVPPVMTCATDI